MKRALACVLVLVTALTFAAPAMADVWTETEDGGWTDGSNLFAEIDLVIQYWFGVAVKKKMFP